MACSWACLLQRDDLQRLDPPIVHDLHRDAPVVAGGEGQGDGAVELGEQVLVQLGADVALELHPALLSAGHREEDLAGEQRALVVVGIEQPHRDLALAAGHQLTTHGVEIVEAVDLDLVPVDLAVR